MSATYEGMSPGGHETYATSIFSKIKTYLDSNPYGYVSKSGDTMTGNLTAPKFIGALQGNASTASKLGSSNVGSATQPIYLNGGTATACTYTLGKSVPSNAVFTDTKNTTGSTDTSSKIFLIGATSQAANPQTYSQDTAYVGTDGCLYSGGTKVLTAHQDISGKADKSTTVSTVTWSNNKLTKTINGTTSDVVSAATILGNLTSSQVTTALGYTPASVNTTYDFESPDDSISFNGRTVGSVVTVDMTVNGKVSTEGDTISGDYVNTADFSEGGVYGKRVTTYGPWGIDVEEYVATSLWSKLSLRDSDILLTKTWDGTNTSLRSSITSLRNDKANLGDLTWNNISGKPSTFAPSAHDHTYLNSAGTNTQSTSTTAFATGALNVRWFTATGKIPGQPSQHGFLLTLATGTGSGENHQIFMAQANGDLFHRGTNASSSSSPPAFKKILDSSNYTSYTRNSSGVIKVKSVIKTPTNAGTSLASPTPSIDTGYKFLCWLYVQSNGYVVGASYPGGATATNATWWFANGYLANYALAFYYLEIKDTI